MALRARTQSGTDFNTWEAHVPIGREYRLTAATTAGPPGCWRYLSSPSRDRTPGSPGRSSCTWNTQEIKQTYITTKKYYNYCTSLFLLYFSPDFSFYDDYLCPCIIIPRGFFLLNLIPFFRLRDFCLINCLSSRILLYFLAAAFFLYRLPLKSISLSFS